MAVDHVVVVVDLVHVDRRQLVALDHGLVDARPPLAHAAIDGKEAWVEIAGLEVRRSRADDAIDRNFPHPAK
jgi:hypothetical protein